ncbi:hypothetical protein [Paenibacillus antarcticus]|uniref:Cthe-2314-like HEPN domain-containing protein n=1 Tax=Paenibacillus antarcticus TaxID=253703 RepID=A0A168KB28_9BACL|nr:hypothetical protein [Paenibacillus antarcticus]OAB41791.1 hypothetical protein PBAT_20615 [Paenibacillus antarcticus]
MNEQYSFSLKVLDEWQQIWTSETIEYLKTAQEKVFFSIMDLNSYYYVQNELNHKNRIWRKEFEEGNPFEIPSSVLKIDYYYTELPAELFMSKITLNFYGTVHSFFDTYAHFLHTALFPDHLPNNLNFAVVRKKIVSNHFMKNITRTIGKNKRAIYPYIRDINNMNKHSKHINPISELSFETGEQIFSNPAFKKDTTDHEEKAMKETLEASCKMIIEFFNEVTNSVYDYSIKGKKSSK